MRLLSLLPLLLFGSVAAAAAASRPPPPSVWQGRSIYFVVTDRFAKTDDDGGGACAGKEWCGGTLKGVTRKLDYIQSLGFDAVWITPVVKQVPWRDHWNGTAYHGYWAQDFYAIDSHLGDESDLKALSGALHARGMLLMVDIVANHVGPIHNVQQLTQLGDGIDSADGRQIHTLRLNRSNETLNEYIERWGHPSAMSDAGNCWPNYDFEPGVCNLTVVHDGWFGDLADLRQEDAATAEYLTGFVKWLVGTFSVDGLRLDTATYMPKWFLADLQEAAEVYITGEVVTYNFTMHASFTPPLSGLLNFPVAQHVDFAFSPNGSLATLASLLEQQAGMAAYPDLGLLCNFVDNHDSQRFLYNHTGDATLLSNGLVWALLWQGIPVTYYGTEQPAVSDVQDNRASMWPNHYGRTDLGDQLTAINALRRRYGLAAGGAHVAAAGDVVLAETEAMAFVRGDILALVTNFGSVRKGVDEYCVDVASRLPARWASVCQGGGSNQVESVFGNAPAPVCRDNGHSLCVTATDGRPSVFALAAKQ